MMTRFNKSQSRKRAASTAAFLYRVEIDLIDGLEAELENLLGKASEEGKTGSI